MFTHNKYFKWYNSIINSAKNENRSKNNEIYYENHHIIPKCMGGTNNNDNLVLLTSKEHFVCHLLLTKFVNNEFKYKMALSIQIMIYDNFNTSRKFTSNQYVIARKHTLEILKMPKSRESVLKGIETKKKNNKKISNETRQKMSRIRSGRIFVSNSILGKSKQIDNKELESYLNTGWTLGRSEFEAFTGSKHSDQQKSKWSEERKGSKQPKISEKRKGMVQAIDLDGNRHYVSKTEFDSRNDLYGIRNSKVAHLI